MASGVSRWSLGAAVALLALVGCDDDTGSSTEDGGLPPVDMALDTALQTLDMASDMASITPDMASDMAHLPFDMAPDMQPPACEWPAPRSSDLPAARALAADPASCGMAPYTWLDDPSLGQVVERVAVQRLPAAGLDALTAAADIRIPRPFVHDVVLEQIVYATQDRGQRVESTALIGWPQIADGAAPAGGLLVLLHGTAGFSDDCAPSNTLEYRALTAAIASTGYMVVTPDFLGLKGRGEPSGFLHPYLVGEATAIAALDGVRAAGRLIAEDGPCMPAEPVLLGISQGGHAALWMELLAPYYAPELRIAGTAAVVPPSDLVRQLERAVSQQVDATLNALGVLIGGGSWYGLGDRFSEVLQPPLDEVLPRFAQTSCDDDAAEAFDLSEADFPDPESVFTDLLIAPARAGELAELEPWGCLARANSLLHTRISRLAPDPQPHEGILFVLSEQDELVHTPIERDTFDGLCAAGWPLAYLECAGADHVDGAVWALPEIFDFLDARRAGEPMPDGCLRSAPVICRGQPDE